MTLRTLPLPFMALLFCLLLQVPGAEAGKRCGPYAGGLLVSLGSAGALDATASPIGVEAPGGLYCNRDGFSLYGKDWVRVQLENDGGGRLVNSATGDSIPFTIFSSNDGQPLTVGQPYELTQFRWIGSNAEALDFPLYFRTVPPLSSLPAGTYTANVQTRWFWQICPGLQTLQACLAWGGWDRSKGLIGLCLTGCSGVINWGSGEVATLVLRLIVTKQCEMVTPDLNFGTAALASAFSPALGLVQVRCSKNASYSVGMSMGSNSDAGVRRMRNGNRYLAYELYKKRTGNERWGAQGSERRASSDADFNANLLDGTTPQIFTYRAEVLQGQPTPPAGTYTDAVQVDVKF
ncbi:Csu type fimbrial protein [Pseudomonas sp. X10]